MAIAKDVLLKEIRELSRDFLGRVDSLVSDALIVLTSPCPGLGIDTDARAEEIARLGQLLQDRATVAMALFQPVCGDLRLLNTIKTVGTELGHMASAARRICTMAARHGQCSACLQPLVQLAQATSLECFRVLHRLSAGAGGPAGPPPAAWHASEEVFEKVVVELSHGRHRDTVVQFLVAHQLKELTDYAANILGHSRMAMV